MKKKPNIFTTALLAVAVVSTVLLLAGCESWFGNPVEKVAKKEREVADSNTAVIAEGQGELAGAQSAATLLPEGRAKEVTVDFLTRSAELIAKGNGPLDPGKAMKMRDIALARLSEEAAKRDQAEKDLLRERGRSDATAKENTGLKKELGDLNGKLAVSWAERDAVASKWEALVRWAWILGGGLATVYLGSIALPILANIFSGGAAGPALSIASKVLGYVVSPSIQFARDRAVGGLTSVGTALETARVKLPEVAAQLTQEFDAITDADHQRIIGEAAKKQAAVLRSAE